MPSLFKQIIISLVLASFLALIFFGFAFMMRGQDGSMQGNCPFSAMGMSLCPQNALATVFHYISAYQSFLNVFTHSDIMTLIMSLFFAVYAVFMFSLYLYLFKSQKFISFVYNSQTPAPYNRKITRWLSLFENSPSR